MVFIHCHEKITESWKGVSDYNYNYYYYDVTSHAHRTRIVMTTTLKTWEWPGDEANDNPYPPFPLFHTNCMCIHHNCHTFCL